MKPACGGRGMGGAEQASSVQPTGYYINYTLMYTHLGSCKYYLLRDSWFKIILMHVASRKLSNDFYDLTLTKTVDSWLRYRERQKCLMVFK
jgi:hypothetical protein